ncbi:hypothetical protein ACH5RR_022817 [Cinchona calisaya]|uniref:Uncharacterized protein n=1 Tax=Cinchona calisaya TaxID=153742 RepID=A0ABD2Z8W6_9GENT
MNLAPNAIGDYKTDETLTIGIRAIISGSENGRKYQVKSWPKTGRGGSGNEGGKDFKFPLQEFLTMEDLKFGLKIRVGMPVEIPTGRFQHKRYSIEGTMGFVLCVEKNWGGTSVCIKTSQLLDFRRGRGIRI